MYPVTHRFIIFIFKIVMSDTFSEDMESLKKIAVTCSCFAFWHLNCSAQEQRALISVLVSMGGHSPGYALAFPRRLPVRAGASSRVVLCICTAGEIILKEIYDIVTNVSRVFLFDALTYFFCLFSCDMYCHVKL